MALPIPREAPVTSTVFLGIKINSFESQFTLYPEPRELPARRRNPFLPGQADYQDIYILSRIGENVMENEFFSSTGNT